MNALHLRQHLQAPCESSAVRATSGGRRRSGGSWDGDDLEKACSCDVSIEPCTETRAHKRHLWRATRAGGSSGGGGSSGASATVSFKKSSIGSATTAAFLCTQGANTM